jgi:hypothetical protein
MIIVAGTGDGKAVCEAGRGRRGMMLRLLLAALVITIVAVEGYYIVVLRDKIERQTEELKNISIQLQSSRNESTDLSEELSSMKKMAGEKNNGNTADRQH